MLPDSGSILRGVHFWEVLFALMLSLDWTHLSNGGGVSYRPRCKPHNLIKRNARQESCFGQQPDWFHVFAMLGVGLMLEMATTALRCHKNKLI